MQAIHGVRQPCQPATEAHRGCGLAVAGDEAQRNIGGVQEVVAYRDGGGERGHESCSVDAFTTVDVSFAYSTPWDGKITLGARNVFDEDPPTTVDGFYTNYLHDVYGRVPYIRYEQDL